LTKAGADLSLDISREGRKVAADDPPVQAHKGNISSPAAAQIPETSVPPYSKSLEKKAEVAHGIAHEPALLTVTLTP